VLRGGSIKGAKGGTAMFRCNSETPEYVGGRGASRKEEQKLGGGGVHSYQELLSLRDEWEGRGPRQREEVLGMGPRISSAVGK